MRTSQLVPMGDKRDHIFVIPSCLGFEKVGNVGISRSYKTITVSIFIEEEGNTVGKT